jgi:hypothetical protein
MHEVSQENSAQSSFSATRMLAILLLLVAAAVPFINSTFSLFKVQNAHANGFDAGTVVVKNDNNTTNTALPASTAMKPGDSTSECLNVTYAGSLPAQVRIYHNSTNTSLERYVKLTVTRGTLSSPNGTSCDSFVPATADGAIYSGNLDALPTTYDSGVSDSSEPVWSPGDITPNTRAYKLTAIIEDTNEAQGLNMQNTITWEARNI